MKAGTDKFWDFFTLLQDQHSGKLEARLSLFLENELVHIDREKLGKFVGFTAA